MLLFTQISLSVIFGIAAWAPIYLGLMFLTFGNPRIPSDFILTPRFLIGWSCPRLVGFFTFCYGLLLIGSSGWIAWLLLAATAAHAAPQCLVGEIPDPACSPGVVASTDQRDVCRRVGGQTYSQRHRMTPEGLKQAVRRRYGQENNHGDAEIDHRLPLSLGGEDSTYNLFWQPGDGQGYTWTYHHKDRLEVYLWRAVCRTHTMPLAAAQAVLMAPDWRIGYCKYIGGPPCK